jgi:hypothetical protein
MENSKEWFKDAEFVGIVELNAMNNNAAMEKKAKELVTKKYDVPIICGHELFSDAIVKNGIPLKAKNGINVGKWIFSPPSLHIINNIL